MSLTQLIIHSITIYISSKELKLCLTWLRINPVSSSLVFKNFIMQLPSYIGYVREMSRTTGIHILLDWAWWMCTLFAYHYSELYFDQLDLLYKLGALTVWVPPYNGHFEII